MHSSKGVCFSNHQKYFSIGNTISNLLEHLALIEGYVFFLLGRGMSDLLGLGDFLSDLNIKQISRVFKPHN